MGKSKNTVTNLERLPQLAPEEVSICAVIDNQVKADAEIQSLTKSVNELLSGDHDNGSNESAAGMKAIPAGLDKADVNHDRQHPETVGSS